MASNVNVTITGWHATGSSVPVPQYGVTIGVEWVDAAGVPHVRAPEEYLFPNILADVPVAWLKEELEDLILRVVRKKLGVMDSD